MPYSWSEDRKNVIELAEFLVESGQITTVRELLDYFKDPSKFTDIWTVYKNEILGDNTPNIVEELEEGMV